MSTAATLSIESLTARPTSPPWALADDPEVWRGFSERNAQDQWVSRVRVSGMHCAACAPAVEAALKSVPGVVDAQVNAATGRARVTWLADKVQPSVWAKALAGTDYSVTPLRGVDVVDQARREQRLLLWRLLVAGFCMMQVMMYQWPQYSAGPGELSADADRLLRWASWVLTLPVLVFSSGPFLRSAWRGLLAARVGMDLPVALGIVITFTVSSVAAFDPQGPWGAELYFDSLTMFVFILLCGRWVEARLKQRTAGALDAIAEQLPLAAQRVGADGSAAVVAVTQIQAGDVLRVRPGENFAVDGVVRTGASWADESLLTGESKPVRKEPGATVAAGSVNLSQTLEVRATRLGADTRFAQIVALMEQSAQNKPRLVALADKVAQPFLLGVLLIAGAAALWWWPSDPQRAVLAAIAVLIVTCPCALALAAPTAMLSSAAALARRGVLVRELSALERASRIDLVVFDKTGTLTQGVVGVSDVMASAPWLPDDALSMAAAMAEHSLHPASRSLCAAARERGVQRGRWIVSELVDHPGQGLWAKVRHCTGLHPAVEMRLGGAAFCGVISNNVNQMMVYLAAPQGLIAAFTLQQVIKPDALAAIRNLQNTGRRIAVLSGDAPRSVHSVTERLGLQRAASVVRAACSAHDKLDAVQQWQRQGQRVAMVGDGINDAPVLAQADASFAFAQGAALAQVKADFLLLGPQLQQIPLTLRVAAKTMRIVKQNLAWAIGYNLVCVPLALTGWLTPWLAGLGMALSSLLVLANAARLSTIRD
jgi:P-type Cu2+ transporter